jgi:hypothetical protein
MSGNEIGNSSYIIQIEDREGLGFIARPVEATATISGTSERLPRACPPCELDLRKRLALEAFDQNQVAGSGL